MSRRVEALRRKAGQKGINQKEQNMMDEDSHEMGPRTKPREVEVSLTWRAVANERFGEGLLPAWRAATRVGGEEEVDEPLDENLPVSQMPSASMREMRTAGVKASESPISPTVEASKRELGHGSGPRPLWICVSPGSCTRMEERCPP